MIRAVLFDLGETLVSFEHADLFGAFAQGARDTYELLAGELSVNLPSFDKYHRYQLRTLRWTYFKSRLTGREFNALDVLRKSAKKLRIEVPERHYDELAWRWYKPLADQSQVESDAVDTLVRLRERGLKLGIVSNTFVPGQAHDRHLAKTGLVEFFPVRVYSCDLKIGKPKKEIFLHALKLVGVEPGNAVFVGDNFRVDVVGARQVGMFAVLKSTQPVLKRLEHKTFHIQRLGQLPDVIDRINEGISEASVCPAAV